MRKVGCAGILVADYFCGPIPELPQAGQLILIEDLPVTPGGCAANVAIDLAKQNVAVEVTGCLGEDADAQMLRAYLEQYGIGCDRLKSTCEYPTSKTVVLLVEGQDRRFIHLFGANRGFEVGHIDRDWLKTLAVFYLGGLFAMPRLDPEELLALLKFCREHQVQTVVDVVVPQSFSSQEQFKKLLPLIDCFVPNDHEVELITGRSDSLEQLQALRDLGANTVIVTKGAEGSLASRGETYWECGTHKLPVRDPSGAGDAFASGVIAGLLHEWPMTDVLRYATAIGASAVRAVGTTTSVFTIDEASEFVKANHLEVRTGTLT